VKFEYFMVISLVLSNFLQILNVKKYYRENLSCKNRREFAIYIYKIQNFNKPKNIKEKYRGNLFDPECN
jgi:hypothetical protein